MFRRDRGGRGGGLAVLLKPGIEAILEDQIEDHESILLRLKCFGNTVILVAVYRPPSTPPHYLNKLFDHMCKFSNNKIILVGDFNVPCVDWVNMSSSSPAFDIIFDIMFTFDLTQLVQDPTRVCGSSRSILDLIFVNNSINDCSISVEQGISDHLSVLLLCSLERLSPTKNISLSAYKDYSCADDTSILDCLDLFLDSFSDTSVEALWHKFKYICNYCLDNYVPTKHKRKNRENPWVNRDIIHMKRKLKRAKKSKSSNCDIKSLQLELNNQISEARNNYFSCTLLKFLKQEPQKFWLYLTERNKPVEQIKANDAVITDPGSISRHFNEYFQSVFCDAHALTYVPTTIPIFHSEFISYHGIVSLLLSLKTKASAGPDQIPNAFLRRYAETLAHFLFKIFRLSFSSGSLPDDWRTAIVVPVHKKGDRLAAVNYRPISLISSSCKMMEHIICSELNNFLDNRNVLTSFQHGFRKGLSTTTQLASTIHDFAQILDRGSQVDVLFIDFSKAFDKVPHCQLLFKLEKLGLPHGLVNWIAAYLSRRTQSVRIGDSTSPRLPVTSGVPQGSVLGPILFLIYINDLVSVIDPSVSVRLFADDCIIFKEITSSSDQLLLDHSLKSIISWCDEWKMELNSSKTVLLRVTKKKQPFEYMYKIEDTPVSLKHECKYLGVTISDTLTWSSHITNVCSSASRKLGFIKRKLRKAPTLVKLQAYNSLVRSKLEYACIVWDPFTQKDIKKLETVQRRAVRFIYGKFSRLDSPSQLMLANGIQTLQVRRKIARLKFLFSLHQRQLRLNPSHYISPLSSRLTRHRHQFSLTPIFARTNMFKYSFFPRTINDWNALPLDFFIDTNFSERVQCLCE